MPESETPHSHEFLLDHAENMYRCQVPGCDSRVPAKSWVPGEEWARDIQEWPWSQAQDGSRVKSGAYPVPGGAMELKSRPSRWIVLIAVLGLCSFILLAILLTKVTFIGRDVEELKARVPDSGIQVR